MAKYLTDGFFLNARNCNYSVAVKGPEEAVKRAVSYAREHCASVAVAMAIDGKSTPLASVSPSGDVRYSSEWKRAVGGAEAVAPTPVAPPEEPPPVMVLEQPED